ncbi:hypothetical protein PHSY_000529 [Pseudozyma hubeiensis SY62]|uniref:Uncharacterized protein n=1 Tax=Pseudozyma hubeiensis (strain SY62) TaxID=1305764 RepID=R9NWP9_PSEHS|nr:hypothetical protein PHSY_000529 [Pseudozyma hubeiensis SY62]GAC92969.1 hypothetical protein PHSY_000529 [Pseudozyma hubeiensis SY62]
MCDNVRATRFRSNVLSTAASHQSLTQNECRSICPFRCDDDREGERGRRRLSSPCSLVREGTRFLSSTRRAATVVSQILKALGRVACSDRKIDVSVLTPCAKTAALACQSFNSQWPVNHIEREKIMVKREKEG